MKVTCEAPIEPARLAPYGEVRKVDRAFAEVLVPRRSVAEAVGRLLADLPVVDIAIEEVPLEEVIGQVFRDTAMLRP